jgi:hypothetical protein
MARDRDTGIVKPTPVIVDERTKAAGMRAAAASAGTMETQIALMSPAARAAAAASKASWTADEDPYYTAVIPGTGLTQAQTDVRAENQKTSASINGVYDAKTGRIYPPGTSQESIDELNAAEAAEKDAKKIAAEAAATAAAKAAADKVAQLEAAAKAAAEKAAAAKTAAEKAAADKAAAEAKAAADKAAADAKAAADKAAADKAAADKEAADKAAKEKAEADKAAKIDANRDAFAALTDLFASYGLESLAGEIAGYLQQGLTAGEALIKLKTNPSGAYAKRFAGNFARTKNGLNVISEAEYLANERAYAETLKAYGLGNMLSLNREDNYRKFADYIAGDVSPDEFKDRVKTVVTRVQNADPSIKSTLKSFYPEITDNDLVSYFLNPKENLPKLQEKVTASEIGAAATGAGLRTNVTTATDLARYGVDQAAAREGYSTIAGVLPVATKLGDIYNETGVKYAQAEGEAEVFKGSQDAATKRKRLASMERAQFAGDSGVGKTSLSKNVQGLI